MSHINLDEHPDIHSSLFGLIEDKNGGLGRRYADGLGCDGTGWDGTEWDGLRVD